MNKIIAGVFVAVCLFTAVPTYAATQEELQVRYQQVLQQLIDMLVEQIAALQAQLVAQEGTVATTTVQVSVPTFGGAPAVVAPKKRAQVRTAFRTDMIGTSTAHAYFSNYWEDDAVSVRAYRAAFSWNGEEVAFTKGAEITPTTEGGCSNTTDGVKLCGMNYSYSVLDGEGVVFEVAVNGKTQTTRPMGLFRGKAHGGEVLSF